MLVWTLSQGAVPMDQQLVANFLTGDSDEIADLKSNIKLLEGFIELVQDIDGLPDNKKRFYEESRSIYQTTVIKRDIADLEQLLTKFFGPPVKPAGKALPRKLRKSSVVKYLGGIEKDQSLFIIELKTGQFYGALWPWRRNKANIEIHLGYCSDWMSDEDYQQVEQLVHHCISHQAFEQMDAGIGGQIHGISLPSFLQMAEMEKSSFTLRVTSRHRVGVLCLSEGSLLSARLDDLTGREAAYRIISWDDVSIDIEPADMTQKDEIKQPLMHVLMESLKLKDEAALPQETAPPVPKGRPKTRPRPAGAKPARRLIQLERAPAPNMPSKRLPFLTLVAIGVGIFAVLAAMVVGYFYYMDNRRSSDGYQELLATVQKADTLEKGLDLLQQYQQTHPQSSYKSMIKSKIQELQKKIEDRDFEQTTLAISGLPVDDHYEEKAIQMFSRFLEKYPDSRKTEQINKSIGEIKNLLDQYYYEELKRAARLDFNKRLEIYRSYLKKFPEGSFKRDVEVLINEMGEKYLQYLQEESAECEKNRRWAPCIAHCEKFVETYAGLELSEKALQLKNQLEDKRDYFQLRSQAADTGNDFRKAYQLYKAYLADHPTSSQRNEIEKEMAQIAQQLATQQKWLTVRAFATNSANGLFERIQKVDRYLRDNIAGIYAAEAQSLLDQLEEERQISLRKSQLEAKLQNEQARREQIRAQQARLQQRARQFQADLESELKGSSRYHSNGDGTFTDRSTGLTWCMLDSYQELNGCLTYEAALKYVQQVRHGARSDWRLPSPNELASLYKQEPYFPNSGAQWYWSAETAVKGYHSIAEVVSAQHESVFHREQRLLTECGAVRAVLATQP
jgi:hypothetical protein